MPATDYHELIRDAIVKDLAEQSLGMGVKAIDDIDDAHKQERPCTVVVCVGPEQNRSEMSTNQRDGLGLACAVIYIASGTARGEKTEGPPSITKFRRIVRTRFNNKRLSGVDQVAWCEVSDSGELLNDRKELHQVLQTALVVNAIGRFPRS